MKSNHRAIRPVRSVLAAALALAALPAAAQTYSQTVNFGDSLSDSGWFRPVLVQAVGPNGAILGRFSTNPTQVWTEYLGDYYSGNAAAANQGGLNFAVGGARTGVDGSGALGPTPSISTQVNTYLTRTGGVADPNALYTVWGGANDLFAIAGGAPISTLPAAVASQIGNVATLTAAGAQYMLVPTVPDLGLTPSFRAQGPAAQAGASALSVNYNNALFAGLAAQGLRVIPLDTFHLLQEIIASPATYGIGNVTGTACQPQITASSVTCSPQSYVTPDAANTYAFADGVHPSGAAHAILGQYAISVLEAPRQIAILPYSESVIGKARAQVVSNHLPMKPAEDGMRWWANLRGDSQRYDAPVGYDGGGPTGTFGVDWTRGDVVFGGFAGWGKQDFDFGERRGEFDQDDATIGGFVAWFSGDVWVNAQASWTKVSYDVTRDVHLGPALRMYGGSPDGDNATFGANAGWDFHHGKLTHGPVIGALWQQISVDGYSENGVDAASLSYPEQDFDSTIATAGWQASFALTETVRPYARLSWEHEFEDAPQHAFARLNSMPGLPDYAVPGLAFDDNYGTMLLGLRTQVMGLEADIGATANVGQEGGNHATVFVTVGGKF